MMARVCVLGFDGLEQTLVEELALRNLLQQEHGRVRVPIAGGIDDPSTPIVWTSFITGQSPSIHGVDIPYVWDSPFDKLRRFLRRYPTIHSIAKMLKLGYRIRETVGVEPKFPSRKNIRCETIFDVVRPSVAISVPVYNEDIWGSYPVGEVFKAIQDTEFRREYEKRVRIIFQREVKELFYTLNKEWKVLMIHIHITDLLGHIYWGTEKLALLYEEIDLLTGKVKHRLRPEDLILIISDHGMGRYGHTPYGFYSLNIELGLEEPSITDFFPIIKAVANG
jgi:hypothetical protein